jgi:hypothetical protein
MNHASSIWTNFVPVLALLLLLLVLVSAAGASGAIVIISVRMIVNRNIFLEDTPILWWCARVRTFVQFASFVIIRDFLMPILSRMTRINEWHESSKSAEITGFLDRAFLEYIFDVPEVARSIAFIMYDINRQIVWMARLNPSPLIVRAIRFILIA